MAAYCAPNDPLAWFVAEARRILLSACTVALVSCGGGQGGPSAPMESVGPAGADSTDGLGIALDPPTTVAAAVCVQPLLVVRFEHLPLLANGRNGTISVRRDRVASRYR